MPKDSESFAFELRFFFAMLLGMPVPATQGFRSCPGHSHYLLPGFGQSDLRHAHARHSKCGLIETP